MKNRTPLALGLIFFGLCLVLFLQNQTILAAPPNAITRAEAVQLLLQARSKKLPYIQNTSLLKDVPSGCAHEQSLLIAEKYRIIERDENGNVQPETPVTRAEFLKMMTLTFGLTSRTRFAYDDVQQLSWYAPYAGIAYNYGIFRTNSTLLNPSAIVTKPEAATAIQTILDAQQDAHRPSLALMSAEAEQYNTNLFANISTLTEERARVNASLLGVDKATAPAPTKASPSAARERIMVLVNAERMQRGIPPLHPDVLLNASAQEYAEQMYARRFFSHVSPTGNTLSDRMESSGYYDPKLQTSCLCITEFIVGENLASGQKTAEEVVTDWMASPTHRETMLNPAFTDTGVGMAAGVWVQHFGGVERNDEQ